MSTHVIFEGAHSIEISPMWRQSAECERGELRELPDICYLKYQGREEGPWHRHAMVYIVPKVQELIRHGKVKGVEVHTLWLNSPAQWALRDGPSCAILAVRLADGTIRHSEPPEFRAVRRGLLFRAAAWFLIGVGCSFTPWPWFGGLVAGLATHKLRSAFEVPKSHWHATGKLDDACEDGQNKRRPEA